MKHKVCYVLPEYREDASTHFSYIGKLLETAGRDLDIFLVILRGEKPKSDLGCSKIVVLNGSNFLIRNAKLKYWFFWARLKGYRDFYVHYSFFAAFVAKVFFARVFYWNCGEPWKFKRSFFRERFERLVYASIDFLVTGAPLLADEYAKHYSVKRERIKIMPNWIDLARFRGLPDKVALRKELGLPEDKKIVLFAHRLSPRKGSRMILPVMGGVLEKRSDAYFAIVGNGPDEALLRARLGNSSPLKTSVRVFGAVANRDIQKYFAAADVYFMPSREEGFPRTILESMASGIPVVGSDVGAVREILPKTQTSYIFSPEDEKGFARGLLEVLSLYPWQLDEVKKELHDRAAEFDTSKGVKKFIELFL